MKEPDTIKQAEQIVRDAEAGLRKLTAEAASRGEYDVVCRLASMAQGMAELSCIDPSSQPGSDGGSDASEAGHGRRGARRAPQKGRARRKRRQKPSGYPKFGRLGDDLVKTGWSRRDKKEYRHKAPKRVVLLVADALLSVGRNGQLITSDDFLPVRDPEDGADVPSYQSYLALGWLVEIGVAHKHGRQGYTLPNPESLRERVEESWRQLPAT